MPYILCSHNLRCWLGGAALWGCLQQTPASREQLPRGSCEAVRRLLRTAHSMRTRACMHTRARRAPSLRTRLWLTTRSLTCPPPPSRSPLQAAAAAGRAAPRPAAAPAAAGRQPKATAAEPGVGRGARMGRRGPVRSRCCCLWTLRGAGARSSRRRRVTASATRGRPRCVLGGLGVRATLACARHWRAPACAPCPATPRSGEGVPRQGACRMRHVRFARAACTHSCSQHGLTQGPRQGHATV